MTVRWEGVVVAAELLGLHPPKNALIMSRSSNTLYKTFLRDNHCASL